MSRKKKRHTHKKTRLPISALVLLVLAAGLAAYLLRGGTVRDILEAAAGTVAAIHAQEAAPYPGAMEIPLCPATRAGQDVEDHEVHAYAGFTLCYRESYELAEWVAYTLTREELQKVTGRTDDFRADAAITTGSAAPADYRKSGYDRGHLAPAADMEWSEQSVRDSFLMSNMAPQAPELNRRMWKTLEEQVRQWADTFGSVTIITGPVLEKAADAYPAIGENQVAVPEYFYKALLAQAQDADGGTEAIAAGFIMPNGPCPGSLWDYAVCIEELEERTGLDFFSLLPDEIERPLEATKETGPWRRSSTR